MKLWISRLPPILFALFSALLAIAMVRHFSDVPFWDMWDGYLDFYNRISRGDLSAWWYQHNEHRIILSRVLFWMDLAWFGGKSIFLIVVNFLLAASAALLMGRIFNEAFRGQSFTAVHWLLYALCLTMPLSWGQEENLTWAFQSQFFLAQILPLVAFYCFYLSEKHESWGWFTISLVVGVASAGAMANGVVVLPLLVLVSLIASRERLKKPLMYAIAAAVVLCMYFYNYQSPPGHGSVTGTIVDDPAGMLMYTALYISSPIHSLLDMVVPEFLDQAILYISMGFGFFLIVGSAAMLVRILRNPSANILEIALLGFIVYIGATAFGTAGGRLMFGLDQALAGRYRTPAILVWLSFLILTCHVYLPKVAGKASACLATAGFALSMVFLLFLLLWSQFSGALSNNKNTAFERNAAVLAMSLGVRDTDQIGKVYYNFDNAVRIIQESTESEVSIFSLGERYYRLRDTLEQDEHARYFEGALMPERCQGAVDEVTQVIDNAAKIRGWLYEDSDSANEPLLITLSTGEPVGYLVKGKERPDVAKGIAEAARYSGYYGYLNVRKLSNADRVFVDVGTHRCWLKLDIVELPFEMTTKGWGSVSVSAADVISNTGWTGSDYQKTKMVGFDVLGTYINSDQDVGELTLSVTAGNSLILRTGPSNQGQLLRIEGETPQTYQLPVQREWTLLTFKHIGSGASSHRITLIDQGTGWGQWTAIGIADQS